MQEVVIVSGARTPIGRFGGAFKDVSASALGSLVIKAALDQANLRLARGYSTRWRARWQHALE